MSESSPIPNTLGQHRQEYCNLYAVSTPQKCYYPEGHFHKGFIIRWFQIGESAH